MTTTVQHKPLIAADAEKRLIAKLAKAGWPGDVTEAIETEIPNEAARGEVLWDLAVRGKLPFTNEHVADGFDEAAPSVDAVVTVWSKLSAKSIDKSTQQWRGAPSWLFKVTTGAIEKDAEPWRARVDKLAEPLRGVVWMGLAEAAKVALPAKVRDDLEKRILEDAFGDNIELSAENLEILGFTPAEISKRLIAKLPKDRPSFRALRGVTHGATVEDLLKVFLMKDLSQGDTEEVANALRAREDSIDELISIGNAIAKRGTGKPEHVATWMQAIAEVILERCAAAKRVPPKEVDNLLTLSWYTDVAAPEILATMPVERLRARVKSVLFAKGENPYRYQAIPALAYCFDEALYEQAITIACTFANTMCWRMNAARPALGLVGKPAIPALERALGAVGGEFAAGDIVTLRKALMVAHLVAAGEHGKLDHSIYLPFPEAIDENHIEETFFGGYFTKAMAKLPPAQAKAVIRAWLDADKNDRLGTHREIELALGDELKDLLGPAETAVDRIERLATETGLPRTLRLYVLDRDEELVAESKNRIASMPLGVTAPLHGKKSMEHVFTLDLDDAPEIRKLSKSLAKARGVALFISSRSKNKASSPGTAETKLVALSAKELAAGHDDDGASFSVHAVDVPEQVFGRSAKVAELRRAIEALPCRALGAPMWIQEPEAGNNLLLQFDHSFAPVNLGDSGVMYVYADDAFWQCH